MLRPDIQRVVGPEIELRPCPDEPGEARDGWSRSLDAGPDRRLPAHVAVVRINREQGRVLETNDHEGTRLDRRSLDTRGQCPLEPHGPRHPVEPVQSARTRTFRRRDRDQQVVDDERRIRHRVRELARPLVDEIESRFRAGRGSDSAA